MAEEKTRDEERTELRSDLADVQLLYVKLKNETDRLKSEVAVVALAVDGLFRRLEEQNDV